MCKVPSTRLKISEGGEYLAVGASDGTVNLIDVKRFSTVIRSFPCIIFVRERFHRFILLIFADGK